MIHWKNKSLDNLSNSELRHALTEAVRQDFDRNGYSNISDIFSTFVFGVLTGVALSIFGTYISLI